MELAEVLSLLADHNTSSSITFTTPADDQLVRNQDSVPGSTGRIAELMSSLLEERCDALVLDAAVMPSSIPSGITIGAITVRKTPYDALICRDEKILDELPENAILAANTLRRQAQMLYYRPDLRVVQSKGSLDSLLQKVNSGKIDAAVVAASDMERLEKRDYVVEFLTNSVCVPAAGQGALAVLIRSSEMQFRETMQAINDPASYSTLRAEWTFLEHLGVDEESPVGVLGSIEGKALELEGVLAFPDGREKLHFMVKGTLGHEEDLGRTLANEILDAGGREIIEELHLL